MLNISEKSGQKAPKRLLFVMVGLSVLAVGGVGYVAWHGPEIGNNLVLMQSQKEVFPEVEETRLSDKQKQLIQVLRAEFTAQPNGTKYSEGVNESWCADFVSWTLREIGAPLKNPNSGSWRIPGTYTLREYFESSGVFHRYGDGYKPETGDVAIYDGNGPFGQHTNFVVKYEDGKIYTVGGNEAGKIHAQVHDLNADLNVVGFAAFGL